MPFVDNKLNINIQKIIFHLLIKTNHKLYHNQVENYQDHKNVYEQVQVNKFDH